MRQELRPDVGTGDSKGCLLSVCHLVYASHTRPLALPCGIKGLNSMLAWQRCYRIYYSVSVARQGRSEVSVGVVSVIVVVSEAGEVGVVVTVVVALPPLMRVNRSLKKLLPREMMMPVAT